MKKLLLLLVLALTAFAGYYFITTDSKKIDNDITNRLANSLGIKGYGDNVEADVSGRDVTLSGVVANEATKTDIGSVAKSLYGVRTVDNNLKVAGAIETPEQVINEVDEPSFEMDMDVVTEVAPQVEMFEAPRIIEQPFETQVVVAQPTVELQPVEIQQESVITRTYVEEPATITVPDIQLDGPLPIKNGRIIRRGVDTTIASKTFEAACEGNLTSLMWNNKILFDSAKATIQRKSYPLLDRIVVAAKNCDKSTIITINGYTDNEGDAEYNRKLSLDRARAVGKYMLKRGVAKRVKVVGHGENNPIGDNDTEEGKAQNRRIEFKVFTN